MIAKNEFDLPGYKVSQNGSIVMKPKLDMSFYPPNVMNKFQIDILKHVEKSPGNSDGRTTLP